MHRIDCSGFVSQALNHLSSEILGKDKDNIVLAGVKSGGDKNEQEKAQAAYYNRIKSDGRSAAELKGGKQGFTAVNAPKDLRPGDTMFISTKRIVKGKKKGSDHIRIISKVEEHGKSIIFETAESASEGSVGPTSAKWRYPDGTTFDQVAVSTLEREDNSQWVTIPEKPTYKRKNEEISKPQDLKSGDTMIFWGLSWQILKVIKKGNTITFTTRVAGPAGMLEATWRSISEINGLKKQIKNDWVDQAKTTYGRCDALQEGLNNLSGAKLGSLFKQAAQSDLKTGNVEELLKALRLSVQGRNQ